MSDRTPPVPGPSSGGPLSEDAFRALCLQYHAGEIDAPGFAALCAELDTDPARRALFVETAIQVEAVIEAYEHDAAEQTAAELGIADNDDSDIMDLVIDQALTERRKHELEDEANQKLAAQQAEDERNRRYEMRRNAEPEPVKRVVVIHPALVWLGFAAAAAVGLAVWLGWPATPANSPGPAPTVERRDTNPVVVDTPVQPVFAAQIADTIDAQWVGLAQPGRIEAGSTVTLASGIAEVAFAGHGTVLIEGPATVEVVDAGTMRLVSGRVVAQADDVEDPFTLLVDNTALSGHGTQFGVNRLARGEASTMVYAGTLDIAHAAHPGRTPVAALEAGQVAELRPSQVSVESQQVASQDDMAEYHRSLAGLSHRPLQTSASVQFLSTVPASLHFGALEDSRQVRLIPESQSINVDADAVLALGDAIDPTLGTFPLGQQVDSYLVHMDPLGGEEEEAVILTGRITFDRPIQAVMGGARDLARTDRLFGSSAIAYPRSALAAGSSPGDLTWGVELVDDTITLSQDRRTLSFRLKAGSSLDQLRILVLSEADHD